MIKTVMYGFYKKIAAAGFAFFIFFFIVFFLSGANLYELSELLQSYWPWIAFYPYAISASVIIDQMLRLRVLQSIRILPMLLYFFFGFLPFVFFYTEVAFLMIAGIVGAFAAGLFYIGTKLVPKHRWMAMIFAFVFPGMLMFVAYEDFTEKENWHEVKTDQSYEASFTYFNGHHKIPVELNRNDVLTFRLHVQPDNGGGQGLRVENPNGKLVPMQELIESDFGTGQQVTVFAEKAGTFFIVVQGNGLSGKIDVNWQIKKGSGNWSHTGSAQIGTGRKPNRFVTGTG